MPGVTVTIRNVATGLERRVRHRQRRSVRRRLAAARPLRRSSRISKAFKDQNARGRSRPAQTVAVNFKLGLGALAENVTVTGAAPLIDTATVVGRPGRWPERTVQEIPLNGRHFVDLGPLMPGGSTSPQNAGLSAPLRGQGAFSFMSAGNRETSVNMMVNGINLNDLSNTR